MINIKSTLITDEINNLRKKCAQTFCTNYFLNKLNEEILFVKNEKAIVFLQPEYNFYHLYFACIDFSYLELLFRQLDIKEDIAIEIICKNNIQNELLLLLNKYFKYQTTYYRTKLYSIKEQKLKSPVEYADINDTQFIHDCLFKQFNKYFDHLPSLETLYQYIKNKQILVKRNNNEILCYIIYTVNNNSCHFNYMQNLTNDSFLLISLINQFYNEIRNKGVKNVYLWVDMDNNSRVEKLHEMYGHKFDGTKNITFLRPSK